MRETLERSGGVGLSANQIGSTERIFVYDCPEGAGRPERRSGVVMNAVLARSNTPQRMSDTELDIEGCLSVPGLMFPVVRSQWAEIRGFDEHGQPVVVAGSGVFARMLQHEVDHLDGRPACSATMAAASAGAGRVDASPVSDPRRGRYQGRGRYRDSVSLACLYTDKYHRPCGVPPT